MPHAAFYVVQPPILMREQTEFCSFNAARGFLCGATNTLFISRRGLVLFQCRTRLFMWCNPHQQGYRPHVKRSFQCRTRLFMWCNQWFHCFQCRGNMFQCRTRLFIWCNPGRRWMECQFMSGFNAARGFLCGATKGKTSSSIDSSTSMPHAAFYVVQPTKSALSRMSSPIQCRTRLFMWCNATWVDPRGSIQKIQCRTRLFMWCNIAFHYTNGTMIEFQCRTRLFMWCNLYVSFVYSA